MSSKLVLCTFQKIRRGLSTRRRIRVLFVWKRWKIKGEREGIFCEVVRYTVDDDDAAVVKRGK